MSITFYLRVPTCICDRKVFFMCFVGVNLLREKHSQNMLLAKVYFGIAQVKSKVTRSNMQADVIKYAGRRD